MKTLIKTLIVGLLLTSVAHAQGNPAGVTRTTGTVNALHFENQTVTIDGITFNVGGSDFKVALNDSKQRNRVNRSGVSGPWGLYVGMQVEYDYLPNPQNEKSGTLVSVTEI